MIQAASTSNYETLKSAFIQGMEYKRMPLESYLAKYPVEKKTDKAAFANLIRGWYRTQSIDQLIKNKAMLCGTDFDAVSEKASFTKSLADAVKNGKDLLENTFNQGRKKPDICFMAWYDALAEYVLSVANSLIGQKAPIPVISEELSALSGTLSKNSGFKEVKRNAYQELKKIYPKTYKKRLKLMEQGYSKKVQDGITEIVRKIVIK